MTMTHIGRGVLSVIVLGSMLATSGLAAAQSACAPGPKCSSAGAKLKSYIANARGRLRGPFAAAGDAAAVYCVDQVTAEVSRVCADEFKAKGAASCASLAYQQKEASLQAAAGARENSQALSVGPWQANCGF